jgi:hypothetical protein
MKKLIILLSITSSICSLAQDAKQGEYDRILNYRRLHLKPNLKFGIHRSQPFFTGGIAADGVIIRNVLAQVDFGFSKSSYNLEAGGVFAFRNKIINKSQWLYKQSLGGNKYQVQKEIVNIHKITGLRGGFYRRSVSGATDGDMKDQGYGESRIEYTSPGANGSFTYNSRLDSLGLGVSPKFSLSNTGMYAGLYFYSSRNHTNINHEEGMMAKGLKNQYISVALDVLIGGSGFNLSNTNTIANYKITEKKSKQAAKPFGGRFVFEAGLKNKAQTFAFYYFTELGIYPGNRSKEAIDNLTGIAGLGFRISILDKIVQN